MENLPPVYERITERTKIVMMKKELKLVTDMSSAVLLLRLVEPMLLVMRGSKVPVVISGTKIGSKIGTGSGSWSPGRASSSRCSTDALTRESAPSVFGR